MIQPAMGMKSRTKIVSFQLKMNIVKKHTRMAMGDLMSISTDEVRAVSTTWTSALILATMSPLRSSLKNERGSRSTLL